MRLTSYKKTLLSRHTFKKFLSFFLQSFGAFALLLGVLDIFFPNKFNLGYEGFGILALASCLYGISNIIPKLEISRDLMVPDTKIIIKVGDLFNEDGNIVIGMNDVFDTEKGEIIKSNSIQGQFLTKIYNDDRSKLDGDLKNALKKCIGQPDKEKSKGNKIRYPIGTVATLNAGNKKYFCSAYSYMNNNLQAKSDIGKLVVSLEALWEAIRLKGECDNVAMAILGSDLARIGNASKSNLIKLIVSSFILASREKWITKKLTIVIHPDSFEKVNLLELDDFLQSF